MTEGAPDVSGRVTAPPAPVVSCRAIGEDGGGARCDEPDRVTQLKPFSVNRLTDSPIGRES